MKSHTYILPAAIIAAAIMVLAGVLSLKQAPLAGSVANGNDYLGTTTSSVIGAFPVEIRLATGTGALGSVVITGSTAGTISFYDATTSDITKRTGQVATSSILIASFPASAAAGDFVFDRAFYNGLYIVTSGIVPTTTITWR